MASTASELQWNAGYGRLPFDLFVLQQYNITRSTSEQAIDNQQLWNSVAKQYLAIPLPSRWKFYSPILSILAEVSHTPPLPTPTPHQLIHLFTPHQTPRERNLSAKFCSGFNIVWLRTCYTTSLSQVYRTLEKEAGARVEGGCLESPAHILDDAALYAFNGTDQEVLDQLLLRMPGLTDAMGIMDEFGDGSLLVYGSGKDDGDAIERAEKGGDIARVELEVQNFVYVVDQEALEKGIVKIWWFDEHGKIVWDNVARVPESDLCGMTGAMLDGQGFVDLVGEDSLRGDAIRL